LPAFFVTILRRFRAFSNFFSILNTVCILFKLPRNPRNPRENSPCFYRVIETRVFWAFDESAPVFLKLGYFIIVYYRTPITSPAAIHDNILPDTDNQSEMLTNQEWEYKFNRQVILFNTNQSSSHSQLPHTRLPLPLHLGLSGIWKWQRQRLYVHCITITLPHAIYQNKSSKLDMWRFKYHSGTAGNKVLIWTRITALNILDSEFDPLF
jgi:hypothetical protein